MPDHIHLSIPPKFSVAMILGFLKGESAIQIHRKMFGQKREFTGKHFWSRGYCVSTVELDEKTIRAYVKHQDDQERQQELDFNIDDPDPDPDPDLRLEV